MRSLLDSAAAVIVGLAFVFPVRADADAKKLVAEVVKAHGGAEALAKLKDKHGIQKGKMKLFTPIEAEGPIEITSDGKRFRREWNFSVMGQDIKNVAIFDGKGMYVYNNDQLAASFDKQEDLDALKEALHSEKLTGLALLGDKNVELSVVGEDKVGDAAVIGVRVSAKGHKDVTMYFDKKTHLIKKIVGRALDFESRMEVEQVRLIEEYKEFEGVKRPSRVTVLKDGNKQLEIEITETKFVDSLGDDVFAKPK